MIMYLRWFLWCYGKHIDIKSLQNTLLKVYVPTLLAPILIDFLYFIFAATDNITNEANKAGGMLH
jgi:hypothetical protein